MNQYKIRSKLNTALVTSKYLYDKTKESAYQEQCKELFEDQCGKKKKTLKAIKWLLRLGMIEIRGKEIDNYIEMLNAGGFIITLYGRANLDLNRREMGIVRYNKDTGYFIDKGRV